jgi:TPR repeat protein
VLQDYTEAVDWYRKAAEQGFAMAQTMAPNN